MAQPNFNTQFNNNQGQLGVNQGANKFNNGSNQVINNTAYPSMFDSTPSDPVFGSNNKPTLANMQFGSGYNANGFESTLDDTPLTGLVGTDGSNVFEGATTTPEVSTPGWGDDIFGSGMNASSVLNFAGNAFGAFTGYQQGKEQLAQGAERNDLLRDKYNTYLEDRDRAITAGKTASTQTSNIS